MRMSRLIGLALALTICFVALAQPVAASFLDNPPPQLGWTHNTSYSVDTPQRHGRVLGGKGIYFGSPTIADIDDNASNGKEVVVGGSDGRIYALRKDGSSLWERVVPGASCSNLGQYVYSKPTVGEIFGDGVTYVAVGYGPRELNGCDGGVVVYRGSDGQQTWNFGLKEYHSQVIGDAEAGYGVMSTVAMADTDKDGRMELAFGGLDRNIYLLNADGTVRWYYHAADTVLSTPLFMNVDGDPELELVAGTDITANAEIIPPTTAGGFMHAFETAPRTPARIEFQTGFIWRTHFEQVIYSSPLAADLLPTNPGPEIAVGSGCFYPEVPGATREGRWVKILRPSDGAVLQTLNAPGCTQSSPAAADIDEDGAKEVVIISTGKDNGSDGRSYVLAWDPTNPTPKWKSVPFSPNLPTNHPFTHDQNNDLQSPVIADLDGNGSLEVVITNVWAVHVLAGKTGAFLTCQSDSCGSKPSLFAWGTLKSTPAIGDMDNDGDLEVVVGGTHAYNYAPPPTDGPAHIYAWTNMKGVLNSAPGKLGLYAAPWPEFRRTPTADGVLVEPALVASVKELRVLAEPGQTRTYKILIESADGGSVSPTASITDDTSGIASASVSGRVVTLTFDASGLGTGNYSARLRVNASGLPQLTINLSLGVANDVRSAHLPLTTR